MPSLANLITQSIKMYNPAEKRGMLRKACGGKPLSNNTCNLLLVNSHGTKPTTNPGCRIVKIRFLNHSEFIVKAIVARGCLSFASHDTGASNCQRKGFRFMVTV